LNRARRTHDHVLAVLLGGGTPLFAKLDSAIRLERTQALATPAATHLAFSPTAGAHEPRSTG
jgi:hypothetical protein